MHRYWHMMMLFLPLVLAPEYSRAQKAIDVSVNDTLTLGFCAGDSGYYRFIEGLVKTHWPFPELTYDRETGKNFYKWFFNGDIDSRSIPCVNEGLRFRVAALQNLKDENGKEVMVLFGSLENDSIILWIDLQQAWTSKEIIITQMKPSK